MYKEEINNRSDKEDHPKLVDWTVYSWFCPNCRGAVAGMKNEKQQIKAACTICGATMIRTIKGRRHDTIDVYAPGYRDLSDYNIRRF